MTLTQLVPPYPIFTDRDGSPLDAGYLYFGEPNLNPETNPIQAYYDPGLTQPLAQPIRTSNGYVMRNGSPALIYADGQFSVTVRNKKNELVIYSPVGFGITPSVPFATFENSARDVSALLAGTQFTYLQGIPNTIQVVPGYILRTLAEGFAYEVAASGATDEHVTTAGGVKLYVQAGDAGYNVLAFNADKTGVADSYPAIVAAVAQAISDGGSVYFPDGTYEVSNTISIDGATGVRLHGDGYGSHIRAKIFTSYPTPIQSTQGVVTIGGVSASSNVTIENLRIDAQGASQPVDPGDPDGEFSTLSLRSCSYVILQNLYLATGARDTVYMAGKAATGAVSDLHHIIMSGCTVEGSANRRALSVVDAVENATFSDIIIDGNANGTAFAFEPGSNKRKVNRIVANNILINGGTSSILMTSVNDPPEDIELSNIICRGSTGASINLSKYKRVKLSNINIIDTAGAGLVTGTVSANCQDLFLNNLLIQDTGSRGIWLRAAHGVYGSDIKIRSAASIGLHVSGSSASEYTKDVNLQGVEVKNGLGVGVLIDEYATQIHLAGVHSENNDGEGLLFSSPQNSAFEASVKGGYIADNDGSGVRSNFPAAFSGSVLIEGIRSTNTVSGYTQTYGVELDADANYIRLIGCDLRGNGTGSMVGTVGANGVDANNIK